MKRTLLVAVIAMLALTFISCKRWSGVKLFSDDDETKIMFVIYQGGLPHVDKNGDGVFESGYTNADLELLAAEGWEIRILGETHSGSRPAD